MKQLFDSVSLACSKITTSTYSTSFSIGVNCLEKHIRGPIHAIYGYVRFADEIVDTFHEYDKKTLFYEFQEDTWKALERGISLNPILNSFQQVVHQYNIDYDLIKCFLKSMETDLYETEHTPETYNEYILGSAEVVGLMCLNVFTEGNKVMYNELKDSAMKLGAAFQKVNFLRDIKADFEGLGRTYFPNIDFQAFSEHDKKEIEKNIAIDFHHALVGIKKLPVASRLGVYIAYVYYMALFNKIKAIPSKHIMMQRVRISNFHKLFLLVSSYFRHSFKTLSLA